MSFVRSQRKTLVVIFTIISLQLHYKTLNFSSISQATRIEEWSWKIASVNETVSTITNMFKYNDFHSMVQVLSRRRLYISHHFQSFSKTIFYNSTTVFEDHGLVAFILSLKWLRSKKWLGELKLCFLLLSIRAFKPSTIRIIFHVYFQYCVQ